MRQLGLVSLAFGATLALAACGLLGPDNNRPPDGAKPMITYNYSGDSRAETDGRAEAYCEAQGRSAYIRGVQTDNGVSYATYDCR